MSGLHQCPHCKYRFEDADSLDRHLTEGNGCPELWPEPPPYHRWRMNEDADFQHLQGDYCLDCGVKRFPGETQPIQNAKAKAACPGKRSNG